MPAVRYDTSDTVDGLRSNMKCYSMLKKLFFQLEIFYFALACLKINVQQLKDTAWNYYFDKLIPYE